MMIEKTVIKKKIRRFPHFNFGEYGPESYKMAAASAFLLIAFVSCESWVSSITYPLFEEPVKAAPPAHGIPLAPPSGKPLARGAPLGMDGAPFSMDGGPLAPSPEDPGAGNGPLPEEPLAPNPSPEEKGAVEVDVAGLLNVQGADAGEDVTIRFTSGEKITGKTVDGGMAFNQGVPPDASWIIQEIQIGAESTPALIGRTLASLEDAPLSLAFCPAGLPHTYTLKLRGPVDGFVPIGSYAEFQLIRTVAGGLNGRYKQEADLDLLGDLDGNGVIGAGGPEDEYKEWTAIGTQAGRFTGTFDGAGKYIRNIYIDKPAASDQGLFGYAGTGNAISNVHILSGVVTGKNHVGGVAGLNLAGSITGCSNAAAVTGTVSTSTINGDTGGVAGWNSGTITRCSNTGSVAQVGSGGNSNAGGVVGLNNDYGTVSNCSNAGRVSGTRNHAGGIAGASSNLITGCSNSGQVVGRAETAGVVGYMNANSRTVNCFNSGTVKSGTNGGGIVGQLYTRNSVITACYNTGTISTEYHNAGGVAGESYGQITACYNTGAVTAGTNYAGGVVSLQKNGAVTTACYNTGTVSVDTINAGGVVGMREGGTIVNSYWHSDRGASAAIGNAVSDTVTNAVSFSGVFTPDGTHAAWGTGSGSGASTTPVDTATNDWWKTGTTTGGQLPALWFE
ncbi:MAG: hypothetical protein LBC88_08675 [Spirochaetaceae bacterium]|jgi:hypothetical protein|nr:hypothetical protein [Spirochaetaceae bacterium]